MSGNNYGINDLEITVSIVDWKGTEFTVNSLRNMQGLRRLGWPAESPVRDYVWGVVIAACGALTILGMFFLFGG